MSHVVNLIVSRRSSNNNKRETNGMESTSHAADVPSRSHLDEHGSMMDIFARAASGARRRQYSYPRAILEKSAKTIQKAWQNHQCMKKEQLDKELEDYMTDDPFAARESDPVADSIIDHAVRSCVDDMCFATRIVASQEDYVPRGDISDAAWILGNYHIEEKYKEIEGMNWRDRGDGEFSCEICKKTEACIEDRNSDNEFLNPQYLPQWGCAKLACQSCFLREKELWSPTFDGRFPCSCHKCGLSDLLNDRLGRPTVHVLLISEDDDEDDDYEDGEQRVRDALTIVEDAPVPSSSTTLVSTLVALHRTHGEDQGSAHTRHAQGDDDVSDSSDAYDAGRRSPVWGDDDVSDSSDDDVSDSSDDDEQPIYLCQQCNDREVLEGAIRMTEVEMFGPDRGPARLDITQLDRIECLEISCGIPFIAGQNDKLMERLRYMVVDILGIDVPGISIEIDPYEGELELEEEAEDNNEEKALRVKKTVQEMGEILFDIKDKITEGEYLKLMDGLQSITNEMNH
jgi:hypothetical protein